MLFIKYIVNTAIKSICHTSTISWKIIYNLKKTAKRTWTNIALPFQRLNVKQEINYDNVKILQKSL